MTQKVTLRNVTIQDMETIFSWINNYEVRKMFLDHHTISWDEHVNWFITKLADPNHKYLIGIDTNNNPIGQIRFEISACHADVSVLTDPNLRGRGIGTEIIKKGSEYLFINTDVTTIHAYIKQENKISINAFENAGFKKNGITQSKGQTVYHYILKSPKKSFQ